MSAEFHNAQQARIVKKAERAEINFDKVKADSLRLSRRRLQKIARQMTEQITRIDAAIGELRDSKRIILDLVGEIKAYIG